MSTGGERRAGTPFIVWVIAGALLLLAVIGLFSSAFYFNPPEPQQVPAAAGNSAADVVTNSNMYMGQRITLNGQVEEVLNPQAVRLSTGASTPSAGLLVLAARPEVLASASQTGAAVQLSGTVKRFVRTEASQEAGMELPEERFAGFEGKPYLMAE